MAAICDNTTIYMSITSS